ADEEDRGARIESLAGGDGPLLVGRDAIGRTDARDDDERFGPGLAHRLDLGTGADDAVEARVAGELGKPFHLGVRIALYPDRMQILLVEAGEDGDPDDLGARGGRSLCLLHHRPAAAGMDGE